MSRVIMSEPHGITPDLSNYKSALSRAFNFYNQDNGKKEARLFLRAYIKSVGQDLKAVDSVPDNKINTTYGWVARILLNGNVLQEQHVQGLKNYISTLTIDIVVRVEVEKVTRLTIQDYMQEKIAETLGELEGAIDDFITLGTEFDMLSYLKASSTPKPYCSHIDTWTRKKAAEFIEAYQSDDKELKEAYGYLGKRKLAQLIKMLNSFVTDVERYTEFKKANRKPRATKVKPAGVQVAKIKYKIEDTDLGLKSVRPSEIVGASQVWVYNCKYKRLAVYRTDSSLGIQVKGTTLQNYDPETSEQKSIRRPEAFLKIVLNASKVQLRKILTELTTTGYDLTGRINEECIILRVLK